MINFANVSKKSKSKSKYILKNINFKVEKGEFIYLKGESGSGKTSILKMIYRGDKPDGGKILLNGVDITKLKRKSIPYLRRKIGIVFQDLKLFENRTVYENIAYALEVIDEKKAIIKQRVEESLNFIKMKDKKDTLVEKLSGGEKQRVAIARAIINSPDLIICDEITGNLNYEMSVLILKMLEGLNNEGKTIIFATHDEHLMKDFPKRIIQIKEGELFNG